MKALIRIICAYALLNLSACSVNIAPWERGYLAKPHMSFQTDALGGSIRKHMYHSKEASSGGHNAGGGGCGCS